MNPIKQGHQYYLTWECFLCILLQKTTNDSLKTALQQLINITEQHLISGRLVNDPPNTSIAHVIDDEDFELLDYSDSELEEENVDFPLEFPNDLDEVFNTIPSDFMVDTHDDSFLDSMDILPNHSVQAIPPTQSGYGTQSNFPVQSNHSVQSIPTQLNVPIQSSHPIPLNRSENLNSQPIPYYVNLHSRCKHDKEWREYSVSDKSDGARYARALKDYFQKARTRTAKPTIFSEFDLIPSVAKLDVTLDTKQKHARRWFDMFLPYFAQYFGYDFWELFRLFISSTIGQKKVALILSELGSTCIPELQGRFVKPFTPMHFIEARDHIGISTTRMEKLLKFLYSLPVNAAKFLPKSGVFKNYCSYVRGFIIDELKIEFDTSKGGCIIPFESIFTLWIEAIREKKITLENNTLPVRNSWDGRPKVTWGNMVFAAVPLHDIFPPQLWKCAFPLVTWKGKESLDDYKTHCKALRETFQAIARGTWSVTVDGETYYCKPIASPDLKALFSTHTQPPPQLENYILVTDFLWHALSPIYHNSKPNTLITPAMNALHTSRYSSILFYLRDLSVQYQLIQSESDFLQLVESFVKFGRYSFDNDQGFRGEEMCFMCYCCRHQVPFSLSHPELWLWHPVERPFENYFGFLYFVLCLLHANERILEKLLTLLTYGNDDAYNWLVIFSNLFKLLFRDLILI